ncbi:MAG: YceI family protein [Hyphomonadaceae bacterium]|nr:YceI family protein [Hyphomonadaceae bacterium]
MRPLFLAFAFALAACVSAPGAANAPAPFTVEQAAGAPTAAPDTPLALPAGEYRLDPRHASVLFRIRHQGLAWFTARFDSIDATITLDPQNPTQSELRASVDPTSVNTGVLSANGARNFDRQIGEALGAAATPQISFVSTSITRTGEFTGRITGDLTMNGQTHPVTFDVTYAGGRTDPLRGATAVGFSANAIIQRSQWGVTQWSMFTSDEVQLVIEAEFVKA